MRRFLAVIFCLLGLSAAASAQSVDDLLAKFESTKFDDIEAAINGLAASGSPQAPAILEALTSGNLVFQPAQNKAYIKTADGGLLDAATGAVVPADAAVSGIKPVRVNNRIRRAVEAAVGGLTLMSPDPAKRLEAAQAVLRSREATALPALEQALAQEQDPTLKLALAQARAAILIGQPDAAEADQVEAVALLAERGDQEVLGILASLPATAPDIVRAAAADCRRARSRVGSSWSPRRRTSSTASAWARSCCWPRSASPSPSA